MATRFYLPSTGAGAITPSVSASWDGSLGFYNRAAVTTKISSAQATWTTNTWTTGSPLDICIAQYITASQAAHNWTTADSIKCQILMNKGSNVTSGYLHLIIRVTSTDGTTVRGVLYDGSGPTAAVGWPLTNRSIGSAGAAVNVQNSVTMQENDRIVIEIGATQNNASAWDGCSFKFKDNHDADLAENETTESVDEATDHDPWIEFTYGAAVVAPTVTTDDPSDVAQTTATCGGNVTADGGADVTDRGCCWSTSANPTTSDSHTHNTSGTGTFTSSLTGLSEATTYHVRAWATNSAGTGYGSDKTLLTGSNIYKVINENVGINEGPFSYREEATYLNSGQSGLFLGLGLKL